MPLRAQLCVSLAVAIAFTGCSEAPAQAAAPEWSRTLKKELTAIDRAFPGEMAVYVKDLRSGHALSYNAERPSYLASTVKVCVLVGVLKAIADRRVRLDQKVTISKTDLRDGSPRLRFYKEGRSVTVDHLLDLMIRHSDNGATDKLIGLIGIDSVNRTLEELGLEFGTLTPLLEVRRRVYGQLDSAAFALTEKQVFELWEAKSLARRARLLGKWLHGDPDKWDAADLRDAYDRYYASGLNSAPMREMGRLLELIAKGELFNAEASRAALERLKTCGTGSERLRAGLPKDVVLAHKTGTQYERMCNVGIAYFEPDWPVVITACTSRFKRLDQSEEAIASVARAVHAQLTAERQSAAR